VRLSGVKYLLIWWFTKTERWDPALMGLAPRIRRAMEAEPKGTRGMSSARGRFPAWTSAIVVKLSLQ
jgi:hypothetical protein